MHYPPAKKRDSPTVEDHLTDLVGLGATSLADLNHRGFHNGSEPLRVADILRERNDGTIALEPHVRRHASNRYVDRLLDDALALLADQSTNRGYFYAPYNLRGRQHGGACGIEAIKPAHHYPRALLDALADLRGEYVITNIGQSGCFTCGCAAIDMLHQTLEAENTSVRGRAGFSAQTNSESPTLRYESFDDERLTTRELGKLIAARLDAHNVPFNWDGDPDSTIQTYSDAV
ncbi:DUF6891 domain-containing protein [Natronosalvus caseinilyticus]|uniref:DUF6891 domain-containing protein n=1 Tax=Natronosalvus caseinilyticus TaxID=2953747 RepID=UPI0028B0416D|nr:hypothetical protein [Natronosalvus caseinilyticus]